MTSVVPPAASIARTAAAENPCARTVSGLVSSPRASTLTRPRLATRPCARSVSGVTSAPASNASSVDEVHDVVLDPERVVEALRLRRAAVQRRLATLEPGGTRCRARPGPCCRGRRSCRPCRRCRDRRGASARVEPGAGFRSWIFTGSPPPARGAGRARASRGSRAGRAARCVDPILPRPSARSVPRCFGLVPICDRTSVTFESALDDSRDLGDLVLAGRARARGTR